MREAIRVEWELVKKRNILYFLTITSLIVTAIYLIMYYKDITHSVVLGDFINTFFFKDRSKKFFLFYLMIFLPLFAAMFYSWYTIDDRNVFHVIQVRISPKKIIYARLLVNFLIGFIFCFILLLSISICTLIITWNKTNDFNYMGHSRLLASWMISEGPYTDITGTTMGNMFYTNPYLYYFIYFIIFSIYSGIYAMISCLAAHFTNKKILAILSGFGINYLLFEAAVALLLPKPLCYYLFTSLLDPFLAVTDVSVVPYIWVGFLLLAIVSIICVVNIIIKRNGEYGSA